MTNVNGTEQFQSVNFTKLGLLTRIFIASDGTLTRLLEAAFSESIKPYVHSQTVQQTDSGMEALDLKEGQQLLKRTVVLKGATSDRHFVYAKSSIAVDRLPGSFRAALESKQATIGELWHSHRIHARKQPVSIERRHCPELVGWFSYAPDLVMRRYRVLFADRPVMVISEYFPLHYPPL